ncbi:hypothetical protein DFH27DRAFT_558206 [Peziza echinospora]|nr:hypothetical protein DFH27DRAFT_558206 [Peziza echinospora]
MATPRSPLRALLLLQRRCLALHPLHLRHKPAQLHLNLLDRIDTLHPPLPHHPLQLRLGHVPHPLCLCESRLVVLGCGGEAEEDWLRVCTIDICARVRRTDGGESW